MKVSLKIAPEHCELCGLPLDETAEEVHEGPPILIRCGECGLVRLKVFPDENALRDVYQKDYYDAEKGERFAVPLEWLVRAFRWQRMRSILRREPGPTSLLDIGCGRGTLVAMLAQRGWRAVGTQVSETAARAARQRLGAEVLLGDLPDLEIPDDSFRVVVFFHVLEHLDHPARFLRKSWEILEDGGLLIVEVPNYRSPGILVLGLRNLTVDYPHHLFFFSPESLRAMLRGAGFEVESESHFSLEYSPFTTLQNFLNLLPGRPNRLYASCQKNREGRRLRRQPLTWAHGLLAILLAPLAFLASLLGLILPIGNTLRIYSRKLPIPEQLPVDTPSQNP
ncbi:MAG: class I SAM-dependent methyltransferase [Thermoanaerobaculales bacterium]